MHAYCPAFWPASKHPCFPLAFTNRRLLAAHATAAAKQHACLHLSTHLLPPTGRLLLVLPAGKLCWTRSTRWQRCLARSSPAAASTCQQQWRLFRRTRRRLPCRRPRHVSPLSRWYLAAAQAAACRSCWRSGRAAASHTAMHRDRVHGVLQIRAQHAASPPCLAAGYTYQAGVYLSLYMLETTQQEFVNASADVTLWEPCAKR
jgi:hypothetical protein